MRTRTALTLFSAISLAFSLTGCGSASSRPSDNADRANTSNAPDGSTSSSSRPDYNNTKAMMMDILHSQQGKQALKDILQDPAFKQSLAINQQDINQALTKAITSSSSNNLIQSQMKDPQFASAMVKAAKKEHQDLLKTLVKDPEYQNQLLALMKSPSYQQTLIPLMQTPECRQAIMKVMMDSLQNPEFKLMYMDTVKEAIRSGAGVSGQPGTAQTASSGQNAAKDQTKSGGQDKSSGGQDKGSGGQQGSSSDGQSSDQQDGGSQDKKAKTSQDKGDQQDGGSDAQSAGDQQPNKQKKDQSES